MPDRVPTSRPVDSLKQMASSSHTGARYAIVTPVRDEETFIGPMIESIAAQTIPPERWIIVDDGSRDRTAEIIRDFAERVPFMEMIQLRPHTHRRPGGEGAIPIALHQIDVAELDYLVRLDADLVFPPDYFARMIERFRCNAALGIAGGTLLIDKRGKLVPEVGSDAHVRGALKMYRRQCFLDIGGLSTEIGWDTLDEISAWTHGWKTQSFRDIPVIHCRPTGEGIPASRIYAQRGRAEYLTWSDPMFVLCKAAKIAVNEASAMKPFYYLNGFLRSYLLQAPRVHNPAIARAQRKFQRTRMIARLKAMAGTAWRLGAPRSAY